MSTTATKSDHHRIADTLFTPPPLSSNMTALVTEFLQSTYHSIAEHVALQHNRNKISRFSEHLLFLSTCEVRKNGKGGIPRKYYHFVTKALYKNLVCGKNTTNSLKSKKKKGGIRGEEATEDSDQQNQSNNDHDDDGNDDNCLYEETVFNAENNYISIIDEKRQRQLLRQERQYDRWLAAEEEEEERRAEENEQEQIQDESQGETEQAAEKQSTNAQEQVELLPSTQLRTTMPEGEKTERGGGTQDQHLPNPILALEEVDNEEEEEEEEIPERDPAWIDLQEFEFILMECIPPWAGSTTSEHHDYGNIPNAVQQLEIDVREYIEVERTKLPAPHIHVEKYNSPKHVRRQAKYVAPMIVSAAEKNVTKSMKNEFDDFCEENVEGALEMSQWKIEEAMSESAEIVQMKPRPQTAPLGTTTVALQPGPSQIVKDQYMKHWEKNRSKNFEQYNTKVESVMKRFSAFGQQKVTKAMEDTIQESRNLISSARPQSVQCALRKLRDKKMESLKYVKRTREKIQAVGASLIQQEHGAQSRWVKDLGVPLPDSRLDTKCDCKTNSRKQIAQFLHERESLEREANKQKHDENIVRGRVERKLALERQELPVALHHLSDEVFQYTEGMPPDSPTAASVTQQVGGREMEERKPPILTSAAEVQTRNPFALLSRPATATVTGHQTLASAHFPPGSLTRNGCLGEKYANIQSKVQIPDPLEEAVQREQMAKQVLRIMMSKHISSSKYPDRNGNAPLSAYVVQRRKKLALHYAIIKQQEGSDARIHNGYTTRISSQETFFGGEKIHLQTPFSPEVRKNLLAMQLNPTTRTNNRSSSIAESGLEDSLLFDSSVNSPVLDIFNSSKNYPSKLIFSSSNNKNNKKSIAAATTQSPLRLRKTLSSRSSAFSSSNQKKSKAEGVKGPKVTVQEFKADTWRMRHL